jgi:hypothetical protein
MESTRNPNCSFISEELIGFRNLTSMELTLESLETTV